jgi:predicted CopG family antitoxin
MKEEDQKKTRKKRFEDTTTIRIKDEVHDRLAQVGHWSESMSDIINRLIEEHYELERLKAK